MRAIDTHAHLDFPQFDADRAALISQLADEQVGVINIATSFESNQKVVELAEVNNFIWAAVGLHPTDVDSHTLTGLDEQLEQLKVLAQSNGKVVAIGEVGLDYYRDDSKNHAATQKAVLRQFLTLADELKLPVIFHCREAYGDLLTILADRSVKGVIHCFTGSAEEAERFLDLGQFISFTATITYPANDSQRQAVEAVPLEKILLETDCPFLSPQNRRAQRNDPRTVFEIARTIAEIKKITEEEVLAQTTANAVELFNIKNEK